MSAAEKPQLDPMYTAACQFGMRGLRVFPTEYHGHKPLISKWEQQATNSVVWIDRWFAGRDVNLALCCGPQPNGWKLLCIDIDPQNGGRETFDALDAEYGWDVADVPVHLTPSGGRHLYYLVPDELCITGTDVLGPGIDTRGGRDGNVGCGFTMLPPSIRPSKVSGELVSYGAKPGRGLLDRDPQMAPEWLLDRLRFYLAPKTPSRERHPSSQPADGDDPWTWVRNNLSWEHYLTKHGWRPDGPYWVRPGKTVREGHSAQLHDDGRFAFWSQTDMPAGMTALGRRQVDGGYSISLADFITAYEFDGDRQAFGRHVRKEMMPPPPLPVGQPTAAGGEPDPSATALGVPQLPEWFWERPDLAHIRQAAWHYRAAPDAVLLHVLTRFAATIHPSWLLPMKGTLDVFGVVIAPSGVAKGLAAKAGRSLFEGAAHNDKLIRMDRTISSGEGLIEGFMGSRDVATGERDVIRNATHFIVDEGTTLIAQLSRDGSTVIGVLCSAWVGEALGQQLADGTKTRYIPPHRVRVCSTINIQSALAGQLYSDTLRATGFTGRCTFVSGQDPNMPDQRPDDPGALALPSWRDVPTYGGTLSYPAEVAAAVDAEIVGGHRGTLDRDERQSHRMMQRVKWSQLLAMMNGRTEMNMEDWNRGGEILAISAGMLALLDAQHAVERSREQAQRLTARANGEVYVEEAKQRSATLRVERLILSKVPRAGGIGQRALRRGFGREKPTFDEAVENLVREGKLLRDDAMLLTLP